MLKIIENPEEFTEAKEKNEVMIANFFATWCGPCQMFAPVLEKFAIKSDLTILKIDIDGFGDFASEYNIQGVPTTILIKNGQEVKRETGFIPENKLEEFIK